MRGCYGYEGVKNPDFRCSYVVHFKVKKYRQKENKNILQGSPPAPEKRLSAVNVNKANTVNTCVLIFKKCHSEVLPY